jgi:hypothetical protein
MDQGTLVEMQIKDGQRLLERLVGEGVPVAAAAWLKVYDSSRWYLYLVTPLVSEEGDTRPAYRGVNAVFRKIPQPFWVHPFGYKVVAPGSPVGKALRDLQRRYPNGAPIWNATAEFPGLFIEGAYVFPSIAAAVG